jgi:hypothetical protein
MTIGLFAVRFALATMIFSSTAWVGDSFAPQRGRRNTLLLPRRQAPAPDRRIGRIPGVSLL